MGSLSRIALAVVVAAAAAMLPMSPAAFAYTFPGDVEAVNGPTAVETVFDWSTQRCILGEGGSTPFTDNNHRPDLPVHAFRDSEDRIQLNISHGGEPPRVRVPGTDPEIVNRGNRRMIGQSLEDLVPEQEYAESNPGSDARPCESNVTHTNGYFPDFALAGATRRGAMWPTSAPYPAPPPSTSVLPAEYDPTEPGNYHDVEWIASMWAEDGGQTVYALFHDNYRGWEDLDGDGQGNDDCSQTTVRDKTQLCWYASITSAVSRTGGATFGQEYGGNPFMQYHYDPFFYTGPPGHLVATIPYQYEPDLGRQGILPPAGIIKKAPEDDVLDAGYYYTVANVNGSTFDPRIPSENTGLCVMRSPGIAIPSAWRGWDGSAFTVQFANPYTQALDPEDHLCRTVSRETLDSFTPRKLVFSRYFDKYMLIGSDFRPNPAGGADISGVYYTLSSNLRDWSEPKVIMDTPVGSSPDGNCEEPVSYMSILDDTDPAVSPTSDERNLYRPDDVAYLYFSQGKKSAPPGCTTLGDLDLARIKIRFTGGP